MKNQNLTLVVHACCGLRATMWCSKQHMYNYLWWHIYKRGLARDVWIWIQRLWLLQNILAQSIHKCQHSWIKGGVDLRGLKSVNCSKIPQHTSKFGPTIAMWYALLGLKMADTNIRNVWVCILGVRNSRDELVMVSPQKVIKKTYTVGNMWVEGWCGYREKASLWTSIVPTW